MEREIRDKFYYEIKAKKKKEKKKELIQDLENLEFFKQQALDDENKKKKKRENEKEISLKILEENNKNIQYLNDNKEKLRHEKRASFEEYRNILEVQENVRDLKERMIKEKIRSTIDKVGDSTNLNDRLMKMIMEEQKYVKDKSIQDNIFDELELKKNTKLKKMQENIIKTNDNILKEKHYKLEKEKDKNFDYFRVAKSVENHYSEINEINKQNKKKNLKYQEDLQKQINIRSSTNPFIMDKNEKKINSNIIEELKKLKENLNVK